MSFPEYELREAETFCSRIKEGFGDRGDVFVGHGRGVDLKPATPSALPKILVL
ncbi:MAG TPA: hypothetical protein VMF91_18750 [Bryobacteraceae bacterium]|nr:hypothetical protein [Bryobacteraceae bacterium]